ncbi:Gluconolactonase [Pleurostoma richardsiae]|uniref:Gluconolactonase n=1 Tax=Pleurostoma richardsiae TaxID=41990 RepID=A0AA38REV3_9PEZI|nr:Gluconolactonase [Pleurostoma richardsiae]
MTSIINSDIRALKTPVTLADPREASHKTPPNQAAPDAGITISIYNPEAATSRRWRECRHSLLLSSAETSRNPFFSTGCIYVEAYDELFATSNLLQSTSSSALPVILISRVKLHRDRGLPDTDSVTSVEWAKLRPPPSMPMPAGGVACVDGGVVFCAQGSLSPGSGGLFLMPRGKPPEPLVTGYYGRDFNSPNGVALASDGAMWFTDPCHGFERDFRKKPQLPCQVYRFHPAEGGPRVVADGLGRPTGIAFSPDGATLYISDTDALRGDGSQDLTRAATIYAFDVVSRSGSPFLVNKRVFAYSILGIPMGLVCGRNGNVYAGCADGVEVWTSGGKLEAVIKVPGGVTNMCFGMTELEMFLCAEQSLWRLQFGEEEEAPIKCETP